MKRRLCALLSALSLALCFGALFEWQHKRPVVQWVGSMPERLLACHGPLNYYVLWDTDDGFVFARLPMRISEFVTTGRPPAYARQSALGFGVVRSQFWDGEIGWSLILPYWFAVMATAILPARSSVLAAKLLRRRRRLAGGLCPGCGYDLRATPATCPECGQARGLGSHQSQGN